MSTIIPEAPVLEAGASTRRRLRAALVQAGIEIPGLIHGGVVLLNADASAANGVLFVVYLVALRRFARTLARWVDRALRRMRLEPYVDPADARVVRSARSPRPSRVRAACIVVVVIFAWAVVAVVVRLSLAPVADTQVGGWMLNAMMVAVVIFALLTSVIVYRSARSAGSES